MILHKIFMFLLKILTLLQVAVAFAILGVFAGSNLNDFFLPKWWMWFDGRVVLFLIVGFPIFLALIIYLFGEDSVSRKFSFWALMFACFWVGRFALSFFAPYATGQILTELPTKVYLGAIAILICFAGITYEPFLPKEVKQRQTQTS